MGNACVVFRFELWKKNLLLLNSRYQVCIIVIIIFVDVIVIIVVTSI